MSSTQFKKSLKALNMGINKLNEEIGKMVEDPLKDQAIVKDVTQNSNKLLTQVNGMGKKLVIIANLLKD